MQRIAVAEADAGYFADTEAESKGGARAACEDYYYHMIRKQMRALRLASPADAPRCIRAACT